VETGDPLADLREEQASQICAELYFEPVSISPLAGEVDRTFRVRDSHGTSFVFKLNAREGEEEVVECQHRALELLVARGETFFQRPVASRRGHRLESWQLESTPLKARMLTFIEGVPLATLAVRPPGLLRELGKLLGRIDRILAELDASPVDRFHKWDIARIGELPDLACFVEPDDRRHRIEAILATYVAARESRLDGVRRSLIHNDANDHNVIVTGSDPATARLSGLIDFGDMVLSDVVAEVAVAMAYCGLGASDPWQAALPVLEGFVTEHPLNANELELVFPAFCARLAMSASVSSRQRALGEADEYALISEKLVLDAVEWIADCDADLAGAMAHEVAVGAAGR
jgi:Ser/Thr protein kinase RdoA (MazF antagonist)